MPDYFKNNEGTEIAGGDFSGDGSGEQTFFSDGRSLKITGGTFRATGRDSTSQTPASRPSTQTTGQTKAHQHGSGAEGSRVSVFPTSHQVASDPESYEPDHSSKNVKPTSQTIPPMAISTPSKNKGGDASTQQAHGEADPPPLPPKPFGMGTSYTGYPPEGRSSGFSNASYPHRPPLQSIGEGTASHTTYTPAGRSSDLSHGSYAYPPLPPPTRESTSHTPYPSPGPSPPGTEGFYPPSTPTRPGIQGQASPPPHVYGLPRADSGQMGYPSPGPSPPGYGGPHPVRGTKSMGGVQMGQTPQGSIDGRAYHDREYFPATSSSTTNAHRNQPPVDLLQWGDRSQAPSGGPLSFPSPMAMHHRSATVPGPTQGSNYYPAPMSVIPSDAPPHGSQYTGPTPYRPGPAPHGPPQGSPSHPYRSGRGPSFPMPHYPNTPNS